jgi:hypothetical protein
MPAHFCSWKGYSITLLLFRCLWITHTSLPSHTCIRYLILSLYYHHIVFKTHKLPYQYHISPYRYRVSVIHRLVPIVVLVSMKHAYFTTPAIPISNTLYYHFPYCGVCVYESPILHYPSHTHTRYHYVVFKTHVSPYQYRVYIGWCGPTYSVVQQGHLTKRSTLGSVIK